MHEQLEGFRLSPQQRRLWSLHPEGKAQPFRSWLVLRYDGPLDGERLNGALQALWERHEILRTVYRCPEGMALPLQVILEEAPGASLEVVQEPSEEEIRTYLERLAAEPLDLEDGPILRLHWLRLHAERHLLWLGVPTLAADRAALQHLALELVGHYGNGLSSNGSGGVQDDEEPLQYADLAEWQNELVESEEMAAGLEYWQGKAVTVDSDVTVPFIDPRPSEEYTPRILSRALDKAVLDAVEALPEGSVEAFLLSCWSILLHRLTGAESLTIGTLFEGRKYEELAQAVGLLARVLPVPVSPGGAGNALELAREIQGVLDEYGTWQEHFAWEGLGDASNGQTQSFRFGFELHRPVPWDPTSFPGFSVEGCGAFLERFDLCLSLGAYSGDWRFELQYDASRIDESWAEHIADAFSALLRSAVERPEGSPDTLELLAPVANQWLLENLSSDGLESPITSVHALIEAQAERVPERIALQFEDQGLSYEELLRRSGALARELRDAGVGPEHIVGLLGERSLDLFVGLLAILRAGGAYLPLDPNLPSTRLREMVERAGTSVVLCSEAFAEPFAETGRRILPLLPSEEALAKVGPLPPVAAGHLLYVLFTSGSTGTPKAVAVEHRSLCNYLAALNQRVDLEDGAAFATVTPVSTDLGNTVIFAALCGGGRLHVVAEERMADAEALAAYGQRHGIDVLKIVPSHLSALLGSEQAGDLLPRHWLILGGEALSWELVERIRHLGLAGRLINHYGPTETTVGVTTHAVPEQADGDRTTLSLGRALANVHLYPTDRAGNLVPVGIPGELRIGGEALARGYLGAPRATAERFCPDPWTDSPGARIYRTGDLVRCRPDGVLDFLGRIDHQVKVRGFRVELGEIEATLARNPAVEQAVVLLRGEAGRGQRLVAYLVPDREHAGPIRRWLRFEREGRLEPHQRFQLPNGMGIAHLNAGETEYLYREIFENRSYLRHGIELREGDRVFDIGANIGVFSLFVGSLLQDVEIYAFEPAPLAFEALEANAELYGLNLKAFACGVSDSDRTETLTYYPHASMQSSLFADSEEEREVMRSFLLAGTAAGPGMGADSLEELLDQSLESWSYEISLRPLSDLMREHGVERIDLLKVDVQKSEMEVLEGLADDDWPKIRQLVVEVHDIDGRLDQMRDLLEGRGYSVVVEREGAASKTPLHTLFARRPTEAEPPAPANSFGETAAEKKAPLGWFESQGLVEEVKEFLQARLPEPMQPATYVLLDELPRSAVGKIDRRALPEPVEELDTAAYEAPRNALEHQLAQVWGEVLGRERVGIQDDFFELGGHSLLAAQVVSRLRRTLGVELSLRDFLETPTISGLVEGFETRGTGTVSAPVEPVSRDQDLPLSFAQKRLWFVYQLEPEGTGYNMPFAVRFRGPLALSALKQALDEIIQRHEVLRTVFRSVDGEPVQIIRPPAPLPIANLDLSALPEDVAEREARRLAVRAARRPFDLERGPLVRSSFLQLGEQDHVILFAMHHIVCDEWGGGLFVEELLTLYGAFREGLPSPLPELPVQYADFASWQHRWLAGEVFEKALNYWLDQLADMPPLMQVSADRPRPAVLSLKGGHWPVRLNQRTRANLVALGRRQNSTLFTTVLTAWKALLRFHTGREDICVGTVVTGRRHLETEALIGFFINTLVLRTRMPGGFDFLQLIEQVRETWLAADLYQDIPFERLVEELQPERSRQYTPLFQVAFNYLTAAQVREAPEAQDLVIESLGDPLQQVHFDLTLSLRDSEDGIQGALEYSADLFDTTTAARIVGHLEALVEAWVAEPERPLGEISILRPGEKALLTTEWNDTAWGGQDFGRMEDLLAARAVHWPDAPAVLSEGSVLTYGGLEERAESLARTLRGLGVGPESVVAVLCGRTKELLVGLLGALKAGGAFLPLDAASPARRTAEVLADSGAEVVLSTGNLADGLEGSGARILRLDSEWSSIVQGKGRPPANGYAHADGLAYMFYTSGSTGRPKGVLVQHRAFSAYSLWMVEHCQLGREDRVLQFASPAFDVLVEEVFPIWLAGGAVVQYPFETLTAPYLLLEALEESRVTALELPSAYWREFVSALGSSEQTLAASLRLLLLGAEKPSPEDLALWRQFEVPVLHVFGLTETTITSSVHTFLPHHPAEELPIGRAAANTHLSVLDPKGFPSPLGVPGELYIGGLGVARGYRGRAALTASRFVPDPVGAGQRLYRTGDLACYRKDGNLDFLGRIDRQVKVRGIRVEPGESEMVLKEYPLLHDAAVVARPDGQGSHELVAFLVPSSGPGEDPFAGSTPELWPVTGEYYLYDELLYRAMTSDEVRNTSYRAAIAEHVRDKVVVDVGTGAEMTLARFTLEAGAKKVYAIEMGETAYGQAQEFLHQQGLEDKITLIHGSSFSVELPEKADICVSELLGAIGSGEGVVPVLNDARRFLAPDGVMIPRRCATQVAAVRLPEELFEQPHWTPTSAHYVEQIFEETGRRFDLRLSIRNFPQSHVVSTTDLFEDLDFQETLPLEQVREVNLEIKEDTRLDGFLLWLNLYPGTGEPVDVIAGPTCWSPAYFPVFYPGIEASKGDVIQAQCRVEYPNWNDERKEGSFAPDYILEGTLTRADGSTLPFRYQAPHGEMGFKEHPFYAALFEGETPVVREEEAVDRFSKLELRSWLAERLPDHLVPSRFVFLETLPVLPSGKIDRKVLTGLELESAGEEEESGDQHTPNEAALLAIWSEILGIESIGLDESFFELGGHSLLAIQIVSRIWERMELRLNLFQLFETPTVRALAAYLEETEEPEGVQEETLPTISRRPADVATPPLSLAQRRLWFLAQLDPESPAFNISGALRLKQAADLPLLVESLAEIVRRHEILRTRFPAVSGEPVQVIDEARSGMPVIDLSHLPAERADGLARRLAAALVGQPFDLASAPPWRVVLLRLAPEDHVVVYTLHHIISDEWSMGIFVRELSAIYGAYRAGGPSPLPELAIQYGDYAWWQENYLAGEVLEEQLGYWRQRLEGAPAALELPTDRPRPPRQTLRGDSVPFHLPQAVSDGVDALRRRFGVTHAMVFLAGFQALLGRYCRQRDLAVGLPSAGRHHQETEGLIGFFINMLVIRTQWSEGHSFRHLVERVRDGVLEANDHQDLPFEMLVQELAPERQLNRTPLFQVVLNFEELPEDDAELALPELDAAFDVGGQFVKFDLTLSMTMRRGRLAGDLQYKSDLFDRTTAQRLMKHLGHLLGNAATTWDQPLSELPLIDSAERHQLIHERNDTLCLHPPAPPTHELILERAERHPHAVAVVEGERWLTYGALEEQSRGLAAQLRLRGVGPEVVVGICLETCLEMIVSVLAVHRAGGAYLGLDPEWPGERLAFTLKETGASLVLSRGELIKRLEAVDGEILDLDPCLGQPVEAGAEDPEVRPENLAYLIYTSGSTGKPKGVMVEHRQLAAYLSAIRERLALVDGAHYILHQSLAVDAPVTYLFGTLITGGVLHLLSSRQAADADAVVDYVERHTIDYMKTAPSHLAALRFARRAQGILPRRLLLVGGETAHWEEMTALRELAPDCAVVNHYGPSETTVGVLTYAIGTLAAERRSQSVPLGLPVKGAEIHLLDPSLEPVPRGVAGEIWIAGESVTRGYLARPALTAASFRPHPTATTPGQRLYRTGDLARITGGSGALEFLGRVDHQVKIRGYRIELGEIEVALQEHAGLRSAAVKIWPGAGRDARLVAYAVAEVEAEGLEAELRDFLAQRLPEYMVPAVFVFQQELPRTLQGKVDRRALPEPDWAGMGWREAHVAPRNQAEQILAEIWSEVLGVEGIGVRDDFFELGGHSLLATQIIARVRSAFDVELPLRHLFESPTIAHLAEALAQAQRTGASVALPALVRADRSAPLPLSFAQLRLWFIDRLQPNSSAYNMPFATRITGNLEIHTLHRTLEEMVRRHEVLRTVFRDHGDEPVQIVLPAESVPFSLVDLGKVPETERLDVGQKLAAQETARPFDLERGPLFRMVLFRLAPGDFLLVATLHHSIADGWSMGILSTELGILYSAFAADRPSPLADPALQYADFAAWQRGWLRGEVLEEELAYWREQLADLEPVLRLPLDRPRPLVQGVRGAVHDLTVPVAVTERLRALGQEQGATLFMTVLAAWKAVLHLYNGATDLCVGTPVAGRRTVELEGVIGCFVNMLALRTRFRDDEGFGALLGRVRDVVLEADLRQDVPFEKLVEELQPERSRQYTPIFQVVLNYQSARQPAAALELPELRLSGLETGEGSAHFDLTLSLSEDAGGLSGGLEYSKDLFTRATIARLVGQFTALLEAVVEEPRRALGDLQVLRPAERSQVLTEWNDTRRDFPQDLCFQEFFEEQVARTPEALAAVCFEEQVSYRELNAQANRLARFLLNQGVGRENVVGILLDRSIDLALAILAVLKAGAAFLPLDGESPEQRLSFLLADSGARCLLTRGEIVGDRSLGDVQVVDLDVERQRIAEYESDRPSIRTSSLDLAYVIYTSGSTGRPKGAMISHRTLVNFSLETAEHLGLEVGDRFLQFASPAFDVVIEELFPTWLRGATVVFAAPRFLSSPGELGYLLSQMAISLVELPSAFWHQCVDQMEVLGAKAPPRLRLLILGSEKPSPERLETWRQYDVPVLFVFGLTETGVTSSFHQVSPRNDGPLPIGFPIGNTQLYVLGRRGQPLPLGAVGELYIGGEGLARGYLGRPALTAERFLPDPLGTGEEPGARLYRTGDRARHCLDGSLDFLGRLDNQVKVRGFRVELGEVETTLLEHGSVRDAAVILRTDGPGEGGLVAYICTTGAAPNSEEMRAFLKERLPAHMVPGVFVRLETLPQTAHGKVDRRALPAPELARPDLSGAYVAPRTEMEQKLVAVWEEVLGVDSIGVEDSFFELGGHSILAIQIVARVRETLGIELDLFSVFDTPTIAALSRLMEQGAEEETPDEIGQIESALAALEDLSEEEAAELLRSMEAEGEDPG